MPPEYLAALKAAKFGGALSRADFECAAYLYQADCIPDIEADFQDTLAQCRLVTRETVKREKWTMKLMGFVLKTIAPLM